MHRSNEQIAFDAAARQLRTLRARLLDTTARSRYISFSHSEISRTQVRVVNVAFEEAYKHLTSGAELSVRPLREIEEAGLSDDSFIAEEQSEAETARRIRKARTLRPELIEQVAREQGIDPDYELLDTVGGESGGTLQTLLFRDRLDRKLSGIFDENRRYQQELGVNVLYACFGFLEWYEADQSDKKRLAPLLLVPCDVKRRLARGRYEYRFAGVGDETQTNVSLAARLRADRGIELPSLEDDDPAAYLEAVRSLVAHFPSWKVHSFVTVAVLNFSKVAMYNDLDPSASGFEQPMNEHPIIATILGGAGSDDDGTVEEREPPDELNLDEAPVLVTDSDFSQYSAICRALEKRSLVVEGPPGTGKSQTITNIIGAALARGESVLFLAEKLAALQVVKEKLDHFGLGEFVLELHSTKSRKSDVVASLDQRLKFRRADDGALGGAARDLNIERATINSYLDAMQMEVGSLGLTLHDVIWRALKIREQLEQFIPTIDMLRVEAASAISLQQLNETMKACDAYEHLAKEIVARYHRIEDHPWFGVSFYDSATDGRQEVLRLLSEVSQALALIEDSSGSFCAANGIKKLLSISELDQAHRLAQSLSTAPVPKDLSDGLDDRARSALWDQQADHVLERFSENLQQLRDIEGRSSIELLTSVDERHEFFEYAVSAASRLLGDDADLRELLGEADRQEKKALAAASLSRWLDELKLLLGIERELTLDDAHACEALARAMNHMSANAQAYWGADLARAEFRSVTQRLLVHGSAVRSAINEVRETIDISGLSPDHARKNGHTLRGAGFFWFLDQNVREARTLYRQRATDPKSKPNRFVGDLFVKVADAIDARAEFSAHPDGSRVFGEQFRGIESDLEGMQQALDASDAVLDALRNRGALASDTITAVFDRPIGSFAPLQTALSDSRFDALFEAAESDDLRAELKAREARASKDSKALSGIANVVLGFGLSSNTKVCDLRNLLQDARNFQRLNLMLDGDGTMRILLGRKFSGAKTPSADVKALLAFVRASLGVEYSNELKAKVRGADPYTLVESSKQWISVAGVGASNAVEPLRPYLEIGDDLEAALKRLDRCLKNSELIDEWLRVSNLRNRVARSAGMGFLQAFDRTLTLPAPLSLAKAYEYLLLRTVTTDEINKNETLQHTTGATLDAARKRFASVDRRLINLSRVRLANRLAGKPIDPGNGRGPKSTFTGRSLINVEVGKQKRHIPLRDLIRRAGLALQQLKPCWMMSPLSVAQFIEGQSVSFDLIVIDEASQMRPEDAIGALARGKRVVVVGDQKQLPPTAFFDRSTEKMLVEDDDAVDAESILDETMRAFGDPRSLRVHYRSRYESLIAFSNHYFYTPPGLIIFPSPDSAKGVGGIHSHYVEGLYKSSLNVKEADAVIESVMAFMRSGDKRSAGVVAMNFDQRDYINEELERRIASDEAASRYVAQWEGTLFPFFVKNLESVQGDERDVIFISTVYGPEETGGKVMQRFGPIMSDNGWRRLNVLFTRARERVNLFTSLRPSDIVVGEGAKMGVVALRNYLEYAASGRLESGKISRRDPDSDFEIAVARALTKHGYDVEFQVGVAGCFVDIGVRDPRTGTFLLGIECDGATYHSSRYARERDRIREEKLLSLGWNLYRIWSTDWFANPAGETRKVVDHLLHLLSVTGSVSKSPSDADADLTAVAEPGVPSNGNSLIQRLEGEAFETIDNRPLGGSLWVLADDSKSSYFESLRRDGISFVYAKDGAKATGYQPGWFTKSQA